EPPSVDPCYNYNVLDDLWRSTNNQHSSQIMCDTWVSWNGWYRLFIQGQSVLMPDTCVDKLSCGTHAPLWLKRGHPTVEDGVVTRDVCGHWSNNCCYFQSNPIKVKACPGGPTICYLAYCAGKYIDMCSLSEGLISREKILKLPFSCVYPQTQTLSMNVEINPLERCESNTNSDFGRYQVRMIPYEDDEFTRPFTGKVDAELDQKMNVEVRVEGVDSRQFALVLETCWATPVNDPDYKFDLFIVIIAILRCPNPNDDTVELLQNGVSTSSRFSFRMFIFTANSTKFYLHSAVHLCLLSSNRCSMVNFVHSFMFHVCAMIFIRDLHSWIFAFLF
uniref:ZP domain-containing protein n=1 Tax=Sinocyclocheilus rhinocerous TaxID=307959 RepID=A0A673GTW6_9TELE